MRQGWACTWMALWAVATVPAAAAFAPEPAPRLPVRSLRLEKTTLAISYNPLHKQADWVFYELGPRQLRNCVDRTDSFRPDPSLSPNESAQLADYASSGYDRGHLSPAADNKFSPEAMRESFLLSNITPQRPAFNRGIWARLENLVRAWAKNSPLWVATGPVLRAGLGHIGGGRVTTPNEYFKVLVRKSGRQREALALLLPDDASGSLAAYALPIDSLEEKTGLDFLPGVEGEASLEEGLRPEAWNFRANYTPLPCRSFEPGDFSSSFFASPGR